MKEDKIEFTVGNIRFKINKLKKRKNNVKDLTGEIRVNCKLSLGKCIKINKQESMLNFTFFLINQEFYIDCSGESRIICNRTNELLEVLSKPPLFINPNSLFIGDSIMMTLQKVILYRCLTFTKERIEENGVIFNNYDELLNSLGLNDEIFMKKYKEVTVLDGNEDLIV